MTRIIPISDLKNYSEVLSQCDDGTPLYLTKNGRGKYVVQSLKEYEKTQAMLRLLSELGQGTASIRKHGGLSIEEAFDGLES